LLIALYWARSIGADWRQQKLMTGSILLLFIGFIGGSIYHACRCSNLWFYLDVFPIALLAVLGGLVFWKRLFDTERKRFIWGASAIIVVFIALLQLQPYISRQLAISISYLDMALLVLLPAFLLCSANRWKHLSLLLYTSLFFTIAVSFRVIDFYPSVKVVLPMGTHFLWHLFGSGCAFFMLKYVDQVIE
jgi:hemolysin III